jgi:hypothetical protein
MRKECEEFSGRKRDICNGESGLSVRDTNKYREAWNLGPIDSTEINVSESSRVTSKRGIEKRSGGCGCRRKSK